MNALHQETLAEFLDRREKELLARVSALRGQLYPAEAELAEILNFKNLQASRQGAAGAESFASLLLPQRNSNATLDSMPDLSGLSHLGAATQEAQASIDAFNRNTEKAAESARFQIENALYPASARYGSMTIKELAIQALIDHFPNGATTSDIREFVVAGYRRTIEANSLRAQMHRLKADGVLSQVGDIWNLEPRKRQLYAMYNHPSSRAAMKELQDEEPPGDAAATGYWKVRQALDRLNDQKPDRDGNGEPVDDDNAFLEQAGRLKWTGENATECDRQNAAKRAAATDPKGSVKRRKL